MHSLLRPAEADLLSKSTPIAALRPLSCKTCLCTLMLKTLPFLCSLTLLPVCVRSMYASTSSRRIRRPLAIVRPADAQEARLPILCARGSRPGWQ